MQSVMQSIAKRAGTPMRQYLHRERLGCARLRRGQGHTGRGVRGPVLVISALRPPVAPLAGMRVLEIRISNRGHRGEVIRVQEATRWRWTTANLPAEYEAE